MKNCLVSSFKNEFGLDLRDKIQQNFSDILNDIMIFYTKKLDMLNIKLQQHFRQKVEKDNFELAQVFRHSNLFLFCNPEGFAGLQIARPLPQFHPDFFKY